MRKKPARWYAIPMEDTLTAFSFRLATPDDLSAVLEIENKSYPLPWSEESFRQEMEKPFARFLVLTDDETDSVIAGYIVFWVMFDECHILNVTVHPGWRGLKLGTRLARQTINEAVKRRAKRVYLEVRKSNATAVAFYQSLGFHIDHIKKSFYSDGEDAYFMQIFLDKPNTL